MPSTAFQLIQDAITQKLIVVADFRGCHREMCPHTLGYKKGREKALFYQFAGGSRSGLGPTGSDRNWRCVYLDELSDVVTKPGSWHTASDHTRKQTCVDQVVAEVAY